MVVFLTTLGLFGLGVISMCLIGAMCVADGRYVDDGAAYLDLDGDGDNFWNG